eukprot:2669911-Rhodomonas_salina.2
MKSLVAPYAISLPEVSLAQYRSIRSIRDLSTAPYAPYAISVPLHTLHTLSQYRPIRYRSTGHRTAPYPYAISILDMD